METKKISYRWLIDVELEGHSQLILGPRSALAFGLGLSIECRHITGKVFCVNLAYSVVGDI